MSVQTEVSEVNTSTGIESSHSSSKSSQWRFKSQFFGMELEAKEALKLQMELHKALKATQKKPEPKMSTRLLQPTTSFKQSEYHKPEVKPIDPREIGWTTSSESKSPNSQPNSPTVHEEEPVTVPTPRRTKKVKETSSRLLELKEYQKWKGPTTTDAIISANMKKLSKVKPIDPNTHLLKPKEIQIRPRSKDSTDRSDSVSIISSRSGSQAQGQGQASSTPFLMKSPRFGKDEIEPIKIPKPISPDSHVLQSTRSARFSSWKNDTVSDTTSTVNDEEISKARMLSLKTGPKNVESRLLHLTASVKNATWTGPKGPTEEELAEIKWQEEQAKREPIAVLRPSERLLMLTTANEYAMYKRQEDKNESSSNDEVSPKVSEVSPRLLQLTPAAESHVYKGPTIFPMWSPKEIDEQVTIGGRLLEGTQAYEKSKYHKPELDVDPRELGWKSYGSKRDDHESVEEDESNTTSEAPVLKVKETSERVLSLTALHQRRRRSPDDEVTSNTVHIPKPVSSTEHFLQPTKSYKIASTLSAQERSEDDPGFGIAGDHSIKPVRPVPASLLAPTASYENRLKSTVISETETVGSNPNSIHSIRSVTSSERFLSPTASFVHRLATVDETKPLSSISPNTVKKVSAGARFLEPTLSSKHRLVTRQDSVGNIWIDALSSASTSSQRSASPSISSIYSKTTMSTISVKSMVRTFETSNKGFSVSTYQK